MLGYIISILIAQLAGLVGSIFTMPAITTWYAELAKPSFTPPSYVFGPAWAMLYTLMGLAAYRIWEKRSTSGARRALVLYGTQLVLNALWSYAFFGLHNPLAGVGVIVLLWIAVFMTMIFFYRVDKTAGWLLVPYVVWISFAGALNYAVWMLN
ncbi:MAG: tryptophan-rich sensory protein [Candidatus Yonathbacteria bacterium]|nr:tryptophan-rich sensory protein [Candidatus Yonathbacteria bacterium]NTW47739.1 tryptophan-rich sensory protein [Candidatus Yonathbacteria bacterium]